MIDNQFFGFIGFDDCHIERIWTEDEVFYLKSITSNLSVAIQRRNSQLELQRSFEEKNTILESIGDGFFTVDKSWTITYWNKAAEKTMGVSREVVLNKNLWEIFEDAVNTEFFTKYHEALDTKKPVHFEGFYDRLDMWVDVSVYPTGNGLSVYFKDISERKKAEEQIRLSNERFEKVTQATNDAIWDWDIVNDTLYWGGGFQSLFGFVIEKVTPTLQTWKEHLHPDDMERVLSDLEAKLDDPNTTNWQLEYRFEKADHDFADVVDRGVIIRTDNGRPIRMLGAMSDITYRKEYEESLLNLNAELEKHTKELEISNTELEQFAYVASHDLQEPLRMVTNFLSQLEKKYHDKLDEKAIRYIHFAVDGAKRMRQIILELLHFSRIGRLEEEKEAIDLNELVDEFCLLRKQLIAEKHAIITKNFLPVLSSYKAPVTQVFHNLLDNALKYSKPGRKPEIFINTEDKGEYWEFSIEDNGIGIEAEFFEKIFVIFQRLHDKDEYSGTGMGLAIVKKIIKNLEGKIWVESQLDKGTKFYFTLNKK